MNIFKSILFPLGPPANILSGITGHLHQTHPVYMSVEFWPFKNKFCSFFGTRGGKASAPACIYRVFRAGAIRCFVIEKKHEPQRGLQQRNENKREVAELRKQMMNQNNSTAKSTSKSGRPGKGPYSPHQTRGVGGTHKQREQLEDPGHEPQRGPGSGGQPSGPKQRPSPKDSPRKQTLSRNEE